MSKKSSNFARNIGKVMKKFIVISLLALVGVMFTACDNMNTPKQKRTVDLVANKNAWTFDDGVNMYFCHFDVPELTAQVYNYGEVSVNREYNNGTPNAYQVALPETSYIAIDLDNGDGTTSPYYYQQHIDYAYGIGFVEVFLTISDYYYEDFAPEAMIFRMQMTY